MMVMGMTKQSKRRTSILAAVLVLLLGIIPLARISAQQGAGEAAAFQFTGNRVEVRQILPYSDHAVAVLYNDDAVYIYERDPDTGDVLQSRVGGLSNVDYLAEGCRAVTRSQKVYQWNEAPGASRHYEAKELANLSNVVAVSGQYFLTKASANSYEVKFYEEGTELQTLFSIDGARALADNGSEGYLLQQGGTVYRFSSTSSKPQKVDGLEKIAELGGGAALDVDCNVWTWGSNYTGKLGNGSAADTVATTPIKVPNLPAKVIVDIVATPSKVYALTGTGEVYEWGEENGASASAAFSRIATPRKVAGLTGVSAVFASTNTYPSAYFLKEDGSVWVLGYAALEGTFYTTPARQELLAPSTAVTALSEDLSKDYRISPGGALPDFVCKTLQGTTADGAKVNVEILGWECESYFNPAVQGTYVFRPVVQMDNQYTVVNTVLPRCTVTVGEGGDTPDPVPELTSDKYALSMEKGTLSRVASETTVETLKAGVKTTGGTLVVYDSKGVEIKSGFVGTGAKLALVDGGKTVCSLTVIVTGDVSGDGKITVADVVCVQSAILEVKTYTGADFEAADVDGNGKITVNDLVKVQQHILEIKAVTPRAS
jgi:hypothetical protein